MGTFLINFWITVIVIIVTIIIKYVLPRQSYAIRLSLLTAILCILIAFNELVIIFSDFTIGDEFNIMSVIAAIGLLLLSILFIYKGGRENELLTLTVIKSTLTGIPVGVMESGLSWNDPWFEDEALVFSTKDKNLEIERTDPLQTAGGIKCIIRGISIVIRLSPFKWDVTKILRVTGGYDTIMLRTHHRIGEFFIHAIGILQPAKIDQDKGHTIENLIKGLELDLKHFFEKNDYPFEAINILIGDTALDDVYYKALADLAIRTLQEQANDITAEALKIRLKAMGDYMMPTSKNEAEKIAAAQVSLGIVKKAIEEKKISLDGDLHVLIMEIAKLLKSKSV